MKNIKSITDKRTVAQLNSHADVAARAGGNTGHTAAPETGIQTARKKPPKRLKNTELRPREYLTEAEVETLLQVARQRSRHGVRDAAMILLAYRHGMRAGEVCALHWSQIDFTRGLLQIDHGENGVHPLCGPEVQILRQLKSGSAPSAYVFVSERGDPMSVIGFRMLLARLGRKAGFGFGIHPHMLRHSCVYKLAHDGQDARTIQRFLRHKNVRHTRRFIRLAGAVQGGLER